MIFTKSIRIAAWFLLSTSVICLADSSTTQPSDTGTLFDQQMKVVVRIKVIRSEESAANTDPIAKLMDLTDDDRLLSSPIPTPDQVETLEKRLAKTKAIDASMQAASIEHQLEIARITDTEAREARKKQNEEKRTKLNADIAKINDSYQQKILLETKPLAQISTQWATALSNYFNTTSENFVAVDSTIHWYHQHMNGRIDWMGAGEQQLMGMNIGIQERPATPDPKGINGKYPYRINDKSIEVKVGYFSLNAYIKAPQWRTDHDKMISAIKALVDLDGLAGIKPKQ